MCLYPIKMKRLWVSDLKRSGSLIEEAGVTASTGLFLFLGASWGLSNRQLIAGAREYAGDLGRPMAATKRRN